MPSHGSSRGFLHRKYGRKMIWVIKIKMEGIKRIPAGLDKML